MATIAIVYHSGYGHTAKVAEHVRSGLEAAGAQAKLYTVDAFVDAETGPWDELAAADGIIFGSPTYMGSTSAAMAKFLELTSKAWFTDGWKDKIAAGFTTSGSLAGDKNETLQRFATLASQHAMIWVNFGAKPGYSMSNSDFATVLNRAGHFLGLATQSLNDLPPEQAPDAADLQTAEVFGQRVAEATKRWVRGAA
ncbi:MAG: flavodoxin family protein [Hyphomonadaceae bacterium]|nr:flavodoxin family protein [Hyphomonadaceae bacterium]